MKKQLLLLCLALVSISVFSQRTVMTWVPPYAIDRCYNNLTKVIDDTWIKDGVTHIGLQFWVPGENGDIVYVSDYQYQNVGNLDGEVNKFVDWGDQNDVQIMLCLYNVRKGDFNWNIARKAFYENPTESINNILGIVDQFDLDGVDIDFENGDNYNDNENKESYLDFLYYLSDSLHVRGKELSVDVAPTPCFGTPGPLWGSEMNSFVDFVNYMGYQDYYEANDEVFIGCTNSSSSRNEPVFKFSFIKDYLEERDGDQSKLNYGLPSWQTWGDKDLLGHLDDIKSIAPYAGVAIWDLQLQAGGLWNESSTWEAFRDFIGDRPSSLDKADGRAFLTEDLVALEYLKVTVTNILGSDVDQLTLPRGEQINLSKYQGVVILKFETSTGRLFAKKVSKI